MTPKIELAQVVSKIIANNVNHFLRMCNCVFLNRLIPKIMLINREVLNDF